MKSKKVKIRRWSSKVGQLMTIPRLSYHSGSVGWRHVFVVFPGKDGIGADIIEVKNEDSKILSCK